MQNTSGLVPKGHAVLVRPYEEPRKRDSLIAIPDPVKERQLLLEQKATVVEVGGEAWKDEGLRVLGVLLKQRPRAKPGEVVLISQFAGHMAVGPKDGQQYRLVNARDIFAVVEEGV